ncbi:Purine-binding protein precursor [Clostridium sp. N3C]|uniref:BMP family ABC transporter substrate-binding protein n=1 Tax=Clostridium sp. N3C TaxID=1776758 RepID=UPI00092DFE4D|nr:BMP family ABC transporter substrate-binding protein [Clostridium sp. N3C]SCN23295.1 Purine-binding protein precursor [Clostridium sp. N3C]
MKESLAEYHYSSARKLGLKAYNKSLSKGQNGNLPSLDEIIRNVEIVSEVDLGIVEIPLKKIVGTNSHLRSVSFANNFMPILGENTEFFNKWKALCAAHLNEGIKHSIKVYEYLNWFYVIEGNKRVSVLKYFDAHSISGTVTRLIPKMDKNDPDICIYYSFLKFNKITKIFSIYFSKAESFDILLKKLENYNPKISEVETKYQHFEIYIYKPFRKLYKSLGGDKLPLTTGDAFLEFTKIYGIPDKIDEKVITPKIKALLTELEYKNKNPELDIQTTPENISAPSVISTITSLVLPKKTLKITFVYSKTIESSGWTYAHEIGRKHVEQVFKDQIQTSYVEDFPTSIEEGYNILHDLVKKGNDVIFTTSPMFKKATLKCAMDNPDVKFFNCSEYQPYLHVGNYFGRTYEPRFLTGIIAGSMTKNNKLGYVATSPAHEVISSINAFALGAKLVNPYAEVIVSWTKEWNNPDKNRIATERLVAAGVDMISNHNILTPHPITKQFGVYSMLSSIDLKSGLPDKYLAAPIWNWGVFYEKIIRSILNDTINNLIDIYGNDTKMINFWWGIAAGVLDIYYSDDLVPEDTKKLVSLMRKMIMESVFHPFTGPIYDNKTNLVVENDQILSHEEILSMDWFVKGVEPNYFDH